MSSPYAGTATYAANITIPSDGDPRNAASVSTPLSTLADRTAYLKSQTDTLFVIPAATNFRFVANPNVLAGVFDYGTKTFWIAGLQGLSGTPPTLRAIQDSGSSGQSTTDFLSGISSGLEIPSGIDTDGSGNIVVATKSRYAFTLNSFTGTAAKADVIAVAVTTQSDVCYDPNSGRWVLVGYGSGGVPFNSWYSTNRSTWTQSTISASSGNAVVTRVVAKKTSSTVLAFRASASSGTINVSRSTDAALTWAAAYASIPTSFTGFVATDILEVSYAPTSNTWYCTIAKSGGTSELWTSTNDGTSWTRVNILANSALSRVIQIGPMLVSTASFVGGQIGSTFSLDGGVTWVDTDVRFAGSSASLGPRASGPNALFSVVLINGATATAGAYVSAIVGRNTLALS